MATAVLAGSTGQVGSHILSTLLSHPTFSSIHAFTRRDLPSKSEKLHPIHSTDTTTWPTFFPTSAKIFFSGLGTRLAEAGTVDNQRKIDRDLNIALAEAAKKNGVEIYVLISGTGANAKSPFAYVKMKGELEDAVKGMGFKHCVIVQPGYIVGQRDEIGVAEAALRIMAGLAGKVSEKWLKDAWAQEADVIAKAAVHAAVQCLNGQRKEGEWLLSRADIIRLGRTEWTST